jgi:WD40 repeat protein/serine/threonine protein kinase
VAVTLAISLSKAQSEPRHWLSRPRGLRGSPEIADYRAQMSSGENSNSSGVDSTLPTPVPPEPGSLKSHDDVVGAIVRVHGEGEYRLEEEIARGGMGRVVAARDLRVGRRVAIKQLLRPSPSLQRRFEREVRIAARLEHPAIVPVYEIGRWTTGDPFCAMKLVSGRSFERAISDATTLEARLSLLPHAIAVCEALAYAHGRKIIHRDLKPSNILLGDLGETMVIDWGLAKDLAEAEAVADATEPSDEPRSGSRTDPDIAKDEPPQEADTLRAPLVDSGEKLTVAGTVFGTPSYMPPEQAQGEPVDYRADVYALGALLYHLLAGAPPYEGAKAAIVVSRVLAGPPAPLARRAPRVPEDLVAIVDKAMARDPAMRYPTARELVEDLKRFQTGQLVGVHRYTQWQLLRRWARRRRAALVIAVAAVVALGVVGGLGLAGIMKKNRELRTAYVKVAHEQHVVELHNVHLEEDLGRWALADGDVDRAARYLGDAFGGDPSPVMRFELGRAVPPLVATELGPGLGGAGIFATFSADGRRIATVSGDGQTLRIWDASTLGLINTIQPPDQIVGCALTRDGGRAVAAGTHADQLWVWDTSSGRVIRQEPFGSVCADVSGDGTTVVAGGHDSPTVVANVETGAVLAKLPQQTSYIEGVGFNPDGTQVLTIGEISGPGDTGGGAQLFDLASQKVLWSVPGKVPTDAFFSPDSRWVAMLSLTEPAQIVDAHTGTVIGDLGLASLKATDGSFSADGTRVVVASHDHGVRLFDAQSGMLLGGAWERAGVETAALSSDGRRLLTASFDDVVHLRDVAALGLPVVATIEDIPGSASFSPDGTLVLVADQTGGVSMVDAHTGAVEGVLQAHTDAATTALFSPDGRRILTASVDGSARLWDAITHAPLQTFSQPDGLSAARFSPDGAFIITACSDGLARIFDAQSGAQVTELTIGKAVLDAAWFPDGQRIVTGSEDGRTRIYSAGSHDLLLTLVGTEQPIYAVRPSPDGRQLATASADGNVKLWDAATGQLERTLEHRDMVGDATWSPDGLLLATACADGVVRVWDPATGDLLTRFDARLNGGLLANSVDFSPDGNHLAATLSNQRLVILDTHSQPGTSKEIAATINRALY